MRRERGRSPMSAPNSRTTAANRTAASVPFGSSTSVAAAVGAAVAGTARLSDRALPFGLGAIGRGELGEDPRKALSVASAEGGDVDLHRGATFMQIDRRVSR